MPEISLYTFTYKEVAEALIKRADIHEGKWMLIFNFTFTGGTFGPNPEQVAPGALVSIANVGLQKAPPEAPVGLVFDAAVVNPAST